MNVVLDSLIGAGQGKHSVANEVRNQPFPVDRLPDGRADGRRVCLQLMLGPQFDVGVNQSGEQFVKESGGFVGVHRIRI